MRVWSTLSLLALLCLLSAFAGCNHIAGDQRLGEEVDASSSARTPELTPQNACLTGSYGVEKVRLALMLLVDCSGSTLFGVEPSSEEDSDVGVETSEPTAPSRWQALSGAVSKFVRSAAQDPNVLIGLQFFPLSTATNDPLACATTCRTCNCVFACGCNGCSCTASNGCRCEDGTYSCDPYRYADPAVEFTPAANAVNAVEAALNAQNPIGASPTRPALQGVTAYAYDWARTHPEDKAVVVLATDGVPSTSLCKPNTIADNVRVVSAAQHAIPPVPTFVIGVGGALDALSEIAAAGGTEQAFLVDTQTELEARFFEILESTRRRALPCRYLLPAPTSGEADTDNMRLALGPKDEAITKVVDRSGCSNVSGGFYLENEAPPRRLALCPASCEALRSTAGARIELLMACKSSPPR